MKLDAQFKIGLQAGRFVVCGWQIIGGCEHAARKRPVKTVVEREFQVGEGLRIRGAVAQQGTQDNLASIRWVCFQV